MSGRTVYFNGEYVQESEARVSIFDSSSMFGDMAFEMTRTFQGKPFRLRYHLDRLYGSLRLLEIESGISLEEMEELTHQTLERNTPTEAGDVDWLIMHNVSRGPLSLYRTVFPQGVRPTVSINCWPLITHMGQFAPNYGPGVDLVIVPQQAVPAHIVDPKAKTRSRLHYQLAQLQGARMGADKWPILLDPDGFLAEGPGWNLFLVKDGVLINPEGRNILLGVSRGATLDVGPRTGDSHAGSPPGTLRGAPSRRDPVHRHNLLSGTRPLLRGPASGRRQTGTGVPAAAAGMETYGGG